MKKVIQDALRKQTRPGQPIKRRSVKVRRPAKGPATPATTTKAAEASNAKGKKE